MSMYSEYDLIQAASGVDIDGYGKCTISVKQQRCDAEGVVKELDDEFITEKPIVQISKQVGGYILVDLIFDNIEDVDLRTIYLYLNRFFEASNSTDDDELDFPLLSLAIIPKELKGECWILGLNPIFYALTPADTNGEPRIIRMAFVKQDDPDALPNFLFLRSPEGELENLSYEADDFE